MKITTILNRLKVLIAPIYLIRYDECQDAVLIPARNVKDAVKIFKAKYPERMIEEVFPIKIG